MGSVWGHGVMGRGSSDCSGVLVSPLGPEGAERLGVLVSPWGPRVLSVQAYHDELKNTKKKKENQIGPHS